MPYDKNHHDASQEEDIPTVLSDLVKRLPAKALIDIDEEYLASGAKKPPVVQQLDKDFRKGTVFEAEEGIASNLVLRIGEKADGNPAFEQLKKGKLAQEKHAARYEGVHSAFVRKMAAKYGSAEQFRVRLHTGQLSADEMQTIRSYMEKQKQEPEAPGILDSILDNAKAAVLTAARRRVFGF